MAFARGTLSVGGSNACRDAEGACASERGGGCSRGTAGGGRRGCAKAGGAWQAQLGGSVSKGAHSRGGGRRQSHTGRGAVLLST
jgi:hypothetical protein